VLPVEQSLCLTQRHLWHQRRTQRCHASELAAHTASLTHHPAGSALPRTQARLYQLMALMLQTPANAPRNRPPFQLPSQKRQPNTHLSTQPAHTASHRSAHLHSRKAHYSLHLGLCCTFVHCNALAQDRAARVCTCRNAQQTRACTWSSALLTRTSCAALRTHTSSCATHRPRPLAGRPPSQSAAARGAKFSAPSSQALYVCLHLVCVVAAQHLHAMLSHCYRHSGLP
jgi:hypothetical protein